MRKFIILLLAISVAVSCSTRGRGLVILHTNDTHSHIDPLRDGRGGVVERAAFIDSVRKARGGKNVLLLDAGDFSQGSSYFSMLHGDLEIDLINAMKYDCIALGNHEFDNGIEELGRRLSRLECPVVCANYDFSPFEAGKYIRPFAVLNKAGLKIGVTGLLLNVSRVVDRNTADRLPHCGDNADIVNKWAKYLKTVASCDMVILLTHLGYEEDCELCRSLRNVDLIVGAHTHTFLDSMTRVADADGREVPVVTDGCWGLEVGMLSL